MELTIAERIFRLYVKTIGHESFLRVEEMRLFKDAFGSAIRSITEGRFSSSLHPVAFIEVAELKRRVASLTGELAQMYDVVAELAEVKNEKSLSASLTTTNSDNKMMIVSTTEITTSIACDNCRQQQDSSASLEPTPQTMIARSSKEQDPADKPNILRDVVEVVSAASLYEREKNKPRITTGAKSLDDLHVSNSSLYNLFVRYLAVEGNSVRVHCLTSTNH
jgi:hypothetical protein